MNGPLRLARGSHTPGSGAGCAMNVESWINGDATISDFPPCADRALAQAVQRVNDCYCSHGELDDDGTYYLCAECSMKVLHLAARTRGTRLYDWTPQQRDAVYRGINDVVRDSLIVTPEDILEWGHKVIDTFEELTGIRSADADVDVSVTAARELMAVGHD